MRYESIVAGTRARPLEIRLTANGEPVDLSDAAVAVKVVEALASENVLFAAAGEGDEAGVCTYQLTADDVATAGDYFVQWTITLTDGRPYVSEAIGWKILPAL